jgi:hypothetical protein
MSVTGAAMAGCCAWHDVPDDAVITVPNRAGENHGMADVGRPLA